MAELHVFAKIIDIQALSKYALNRLLHLTFGVNDAHVLCSMFKYMSSEGKDGTEELREWAKRKLKNEGVVAAWTVSTLFRAELKDPKFFSFMVDLACDLAESERLSAKEIFQLFWTTGTPN